MKLLDRVYRATLMARTRRRPTNRAGLGIIFPLILLALAEPAAAFPRTGDHRPQSAGPADLVLRGGSIVTLDSRIGRAQAIAVRGDTIAAVGSDRQIRSLIGPRTRVIELGNAVAYPGFIEGHGHFVNLGQAKRRLDLARSANWDAIVAQVAEVARRAKPGEWILGRGWHQEKWDRAPSPNVEGFPTHEALSRVSRDNPVLLTHRSGHATFANAMAMRLAGIDRTTPDPPGGQILHDAEGNPTGLFRESASQIIQRRLDQDLASRTGEEVEADLSRSIEAATDEALRKGITTFHDAGSSLATIEAFRRLANRGALRIRLWVMIRENPAVLRSNLDRARVVGSGGGYLTVRAVKVILDGALGTRGAWLLEPYSDMPGSTGLNVTPLDSLAETAQLAIEHGYQVCVHAIGDRANREVLNVYERAFRDHPGAKDLRWRIEHAQHLSPADIPRFASLGVIASMQGVHCTSDARWALARLGAKRCEEGAYVWQKLMKTGAIIANGTDAPVEDVNPIACYYASVTRRDRDGFVFYPDQAMTRMEALASYTSNTAYAGFEENRKGSLSPGKLADITVLSQDITTVPEEAIMKTDVLYTIVGGRVAYARQASASSAP